MSGAPEEGRPGVLVTAFEPFDDDEENPSQQLVEALEADPPALDELRLGTVVLPVDRVRLSHALEQALRRHRPAIVVATGQAAGREQIDLETRAVNRLDYGGRRDNGGHAARDERLFPRGPRVLRSAPGLRALAEDCRRAGLPIVLSDDAGSHLCNALLYELLWHHPSLQSTFLHLPLLPTQARRRGRDEPHLSLTEIRAAVAEFLGRLGSGSGDATS